MGRPAAFAPAAQRRASIRSVTAALTSPLVIGSGDDAPASRRGPAVSAASGSIPRSDQPGALGLQEHRGGVGVGRPQRRRQLRQVGAPVRSTRCHPAGSRPAHGRRAAVRVGPADRAARRDRPAGSRPPAATSRRGPGSPGPSRAGSARPVRCAARPVPERCGRPAAGRPRRRRGRPASCPICGLLGCPVQAASAGGGGAPVAWVGSVGRRRCRSAWLVGRQRVVVASVASALLVAQSPVAAERVGSAR